MIAFSNFVQTPNQVLSYELASEQFHSRCIRIPYPQEVQQVSGAVFTQCVYNFTLSGNC